MVDDSGEKHIGKSEKNISQLESQIGTKDDNSIATKTERSKQESFCSDTLRAVSDDKSNSLQIVDGDSVLLDSHSKRAGAGAEVPNNGATTDGAKGETGNAKVFIPGAGEVELNAEAMLQAKADPLRKADGSFKDNLVAYDGYNKETGRFELGTNQNVELFKPYVDSEGVVPFGGKVSVDAEGRPKSGLYATATIGITGFYKGIERDKQVLNVNISDKLKVNGQDIFDGKPHRAVFPIAPMPGEHDPGHWKWIDATVQKIGTQAELVIYRVSPNVEKPTNDSEFDHWPREQAIFPLKVFSSTQHADMQDVFGDGRQRRPVDPRNNWQRNWLQASVTEQVE